MRVLSKKEVNMTEGSIWRHIVGFAAPMLLGLLFQQLYNTVDSIVVGNFVGKEALAAVGSTTQIINMLIGVFSGFSTGAGVVIAQFFGANDDKKVREAVHTTMLFMLILSAAFTVIGMILVNPMLRMMSTPDDVFREASTYLTVYFAGVSGLMIYNTGSGILRAVGDSKRPLYFLIFSACVNTALDLVFVVAFKMGVAGVAWATVISQVLSAALVVWVLMRSDASYKLELSSLKITPPMLGTVLGLGLPTAVQHGLTAFSNVFVQSYINAFGSACMAGWSVYNKIDAFLGIPTDAAAMAVTTFAGQNMGAKKYARVERGMYVAMGITAGVTAVLMVPFMIFAKQLALLFNDDPDVLMYGIKFVRIMMPFYLVRCVFNSYAGTLRGSGDATGPMIIILGCFVAFRQVYLAVISKLVGTAVSVALGYPVGWSMAMLAFAVYYNVRKKKNMLNR